MLPKNIFHQSWLIDIVCLTFICLLFYTFWLGSYPFFTPDEGRYSEVAREMLATGDFITPRVNGVAFLDKPVLYYWLQALALYFFGVSEWAVRIFPSLFGIFGITMTYICGRKLFDRRSAFLSAIILASAPLYFCSAHYANLDLEVAVLISSALLCFITAMKSARPTTLLILAYVFAGLACLTKGMIGIAFPMIIIGTWILVQWRWRTLLNMLLIPGLAIVVAINLPWYYLVQQANPEFLHYFFVTQQVTRFLSHATFNNVMPIWFYAPVVLFGFFPWTIFLFQALTKSIKQVWKNSQAYATETFMLIWIIVLFVFFSIPHSKAVTYIMPIFPPMALLVGNYISTYWDNARQRGITWAIANYVVVGLALAFTLIAIGYFGLFNIAPKFNQTLRIAAIIFSCSNLAVLLCLKQSTLKPLFALCVSVSTLFLLTLLSGAGNINADSTKHLVAELKQIKQPQDEVIHYNKFYQDVPLYLGQQVTIVADWNSPRIQYEDNWRRELWYGMPFQKTDQLISEDAFWLRWNSAKRVFVFLNDNYLSQFRAHTQKYFVIDTSNDVYLLSNKPVKPAQAS